ncbi:DUF6199 family natural product biosynthesis protein [Stackebrandtia albiflava]|nr:DUF6199 family natural product biosynthesis protein [Stackebrandtia albiflava]
MTWLAVILFVAALIPLWIAISPKGMWRTTAAWQYRNPEANEPSEAGYAVQRVSAAIGALIMVGFGVFLLSIEDDVAAERERETYEECLAQNDDDEGLLTPEQWCEDLSPAPDSTG